jgi:site-specific DNA recombinase
VRTVAAGTIETAVVEQLRAVFRSPELIAQTFHGARSRESEERERLRNEEGELRDRLRALKEVAARLIDANGGGAAIGDELHQAVAEMDDVKRRLEVVAAERRGLEANEITERDVIEAMEKLDPVWDELFPAEQTRIVQLLVERVEVKADGIDLRLRSDGLRSLVTAVGAGRDRRQETTTR